MPNPTQTPEHRPDSLSADKLCELTGLTDRRHRQLAKEGWFPAPYRGQYKAAATIAGLFKYFRAALTKRDDTEKTEKARLATVKRETAEEQLAILREEYVPKKDIGPALRNLALHQRSVLTRKFETDMRSRLPAEFHPMLSHAVDEICATFTDGIRRWLEAPPKEDEA